MLKNYLSESEWERKKNREILKAFGISRWRKLFGMHGRELLNLEEIAQRIGPIFSITNFEEAKQKANKLLGKLVDDYHFEELIDANNNVRYRLYHSCRKETLTGFSL